MTTPTYRSATDIMALLRTLPTTSARRVLTGQHLPNWESAAEGAADYVRGQALLGTTVLTGADDDYTNQAGLADRLGQHMAAGGLALLDIHPANPRAAVGKRHIGTAWLSSGVARPVITSLYLAAPTSTVRTAWWSQVDRLLGFLNRLPAGSTPILRPFHEANGSYFWWGYNPTSITSRAAQSAQLVQLTTDLHDYLTPRLRPGVTVLWAHTGNALDWDTGIDYGRWSWVDVVGCSLYSDDLTMPNKHGDTYANLVATGKPVIFAEVGPDVNKPQLGTWDSTVIINRIRSTYPAVVAWQGWQQNDETHLLSPVENRNCAQLLTDPWSVQLADLTSVISPSPAPTRMFVAMRVPATLTILPGGGSTVSGAALGVYDSPEAVRAAHPECVAVEVSSGS